MRERTWWVIGRALLLSPRSKRSMVSRGWEGGSPWRMWVWTRSGVTDARAVRVKKAATKDVRLANSQRRLEFIVAPLYMGKEIHGKRRYNCSAVIAHEYVAFIRSRCFDGHSRSRGDSTAGGAPRGIESERVALSTTTRCVTGAVGGRAFRWWRGCLASRDVSGM